MVIVVSDKYSVRRNCIDVARSYPGIDLYYGDDEGVFGKFSWPRYLYLIKKKSSYLVAFTGYGVDQLSRLSGFSSFREGDEILFGSYRGSEYSPHLIKKELFPILNTLAPSAHYSNQLISRFKRDGECDYLNQAKEFGEDVLELIHRASCGFVMEKYFPNPIRLVSDGDVDKFGQDFVDMINDVSCFSAAGAKERKFKFLNPLVEDYGDDLIALVLNVCEAYYDAMSARFNENLFVCNLLDDDCRFIGDYSRV